MWKSINKLCRNCGEERELNIIGVCESCFKSSNKYQFYEAMRYLQIDRNYKLNVDVDSNFNVIRTNSDEIIFVKDFLEDVDCIRSHDVDNKEIGNHIFQEDRRLKFESSQKLLRNEKIL